MSIETFDPAVNKDGYFIDYCCGYDIIKSDDANQNEVEVSESQSVDSSASSSLETMGAMQTPDQLGYGCGKKAADMFCQLKGFQEASTYDVVYYSHEPTYVVGEDIVRDPDQSRGLGHHVFFNLINCQKVKDMLVRTLYGLIVFYFIL